MSLILLIALQVPAVYQKLQVPEQELLVFNSRRNSLIGFVDGDKADFLVDGELAPEQMERLIKPLILRKKIKKVAWDTLKPVEVRAAGNSIVLILGKETSIAGHDTRLPQPDYIILRKGGLRSGRLLAERFPKAHVILDASVYQSDRQEFLTQLPELSLNAHDVRESGAFVRGLGNPSLSFCGQVAP